jgi:hypothetical protein
MDFNIQFHWKRRSYYVLRFFTVTEVKKNREKIARHKFELWFKFPMAIDSFIIIPGVSRQKKGCKAKSYRNIKLLNVSSVERNWFLLIDSAILIISTSDEVFNILYNRATCAVFLKLGISGAAVDEVCCRWVDKKENFGWVSLAKDVMKVEAGSFAIFKVLC